MEQYYDRPTQVIFVEEEDLLHNGPYEACKCRGIAYRDEVICCCCGGVFSLDEIAYIYEEPCWYNTDMEMIGYGSEAIIRDEIAEAYDWLMEDKPE